MAYDTNVCIKNNDIRKIALNNEIYIYISDKNHGVISTIYQNLESGYYLVKWTSEMYTLQYTKKLGNDVIKAGDLGCGSVYLNPLANFK